MENERRLPPGFEDLETWVTDWALPDSRARCEKRQRSSADEIRAFYNALLPRAEPALAHLSQSQLGALDPAIETLLKLLLSLAEVGPAVEWYGQPQVVDGFDPKKFPLVLQIADNAAQE